MTSTSKVNKRCMSPEYKLEFYNRNALNFKLKPCKI